MENTPVLVQVLSRVFFRPVRGQSAKPTPLGGPKKYSKHVSQGKHGQGRGKGLEGPRNYRLIRSLARPIKIKSRRRRTSQGVG